MTSLPQQTPVVVLVTGASGFVGRHLIAHLLSAQSVVGDVASGPVKIVAAVHPVLDRAEPSCVAALTGWNPAIADSRVTTVPLDVAEPAAIASVLAQYRPHQIYHLAARASGADADRERVFGINVGGTRHLLAAASARLPGTRVLLASTGYVYGETDPAHPAREVDPLAPLGRYGAYTDSKIEMEGVAQSYGDVALIARAFAHTGPGQTPTFAVPSFARQLARIEAGLAPPELAVGNLEALRDLLDVRDVVRAYRLLMTWGAPGEVANVSLGQPRSMREILEGMIGRCSVPVTVRIDANRLRPADIACSSGDASRLSRLAAWTPAHSLEETLDATLNYWRERVKAE